MELVGIWPEPSRSDQRWPNFKALLFIFVIIFFGTGPQSVNLLFIWGDLGLVTENLSTANIPGINAMMKLIIAWHHRDAFKPVIKSFYDDWKTSRTKEEKETMLKRAKFAKQISIWCSVLTLTMVTVYLSLRAWIIYQLDRANQKQDRLLLYPGYFPFDIRPIGVLLSTNFGQVLAAYSAVISYTTVDTFIAMLIMHICGQFEILRQKLRRLMDDEKKTRSVDEIQKELVLIIERHEHLNWFATMIEDCFNTLLLIQMLLCTVEICFQGFLFFDSREMSNSAYESNWYNVSPPEAKCLLFIMHRTARPLCLTAGKFSTFSMEMFSTILKTAMGYLSVLLTVTGSD
ncbi:PREDICTED: odorant receptor 9a-like [Habropoda laboriosa]|uniref:odorant receptor 9a-like n=1 Tax=Habropoda laboriosa TaxID=597456 RepID=UPI00083E6858|nr:PREDICTED: odorant receptor 9a-like [Habropoda laboriosa]